QAGPETGNLEKQFGAIVVEEIIILGDFVVTPDVEGNGGIDMALAEAVVWQPASRFGVEVDCLGFLPSRAAALPGKHGATQAGVLGGDSSFWQAAVAIAQQGPGQNRDP